ncbi:MAG: hypothetical protein IJP04_04815 [Clostridia bacterium]|nr:hypothetical protein [Clostridia bacterium]
METNLLEKSIEYLLCHAGPVIQYRLRKDVLQNISQEQEAACLRAIEELPYFQLVKSYAKENGYIGSGMHSWGNWRGKILHETPLQDGENAARLLSYYRIPKGHPLVKNFVAAMRNDAVLEKEFSYIPPEIPRYQNRFIGLNNGNCLMAMMYAMQAMLGYGDDFDDLIAFQEICLKGFRRILEMDSLADITKTSTRAKQKYNYPYIEAHEYFPDVYTLAMLAYTQSWRSEENIRMLAGAINHINTIMTDENNMHVRIAGKYYAPCFAFIRPFRAFHPNCIDSITYRRMLTEMAMLGVGQEVDVLRESAENILTAMDENGILRMNFSVPHNPRYSPKKIDYPSAYTDVRLEEDYRQNRHGLNCDLTFWAVELLHLLGGNAPMVR